jgi:hypothetical protein
VPYRDRSPLDDRSTERLNPAIAGRPDLMGGRTSLTVYDGMVGLSENVFINVKKRSHSITAELMVPDKGVEGVILAQAGRFGGWSLYVKDGKPTYTYNYLDQKRTSITSSGTPAPGKATVVFDFAYEGLRRSRRLTAAAMPPTASPSVVLVVVPVVTAPRSAVPPGHDNAARQREHDHCERSNSPGP